MYRGEPYKLDSFAAKQGTVSIAPIDTHDNEVESFELSTESFFVWEIRNKFWLCVDVQDL